MIAACSTASGRIKKGLCGSYVSIFPIFAAIYFGLSEIAWAELTLNASEAVAALEQGLEPNASMEKMSDAGRRAEELMLGQSTSGSPRAEASSESKLNFLARLSTPLPGRRKSIVVREPRSHKDICAHIGEKIGSLGLGAGGAYAGAWTMGLTQWLLSSSRGPLDLIQVSVIATMIISSAIGGYQIGRVSGWNIGWAIGRLLDCWRGPRG